MDENEMICDCFGVTLKDIKEAIDNGAKTLEEVQEVTNLGNACGSCIENAKEIVDGLF